MSLQYIKDDKGQTTGVFIPIQEWDSLKFKYEGLEEEAYAVPEWQKEMVLGRIKNSAPEKLIPWNEAHRKLRFKDKS